jgi:hypothetical protein
MKAALTALILAIGFAIPASAQNVVSLGDAGRVSEPISLPHPVVDEVLETYADFGMRSQLTDPELVREHRRITAKLDAHIALFVSEQPYTAFQHTLGISGYETYFAHPDEAFHVLSIAMPHLGEPTEATVRNWLAEQITKHPPYAIQGYERAFGLPRESYDVPPDLRIGGASQASNAFGVYAFWEYVHWVVEPLQPNDQRFTRELVRRHWPSLKERVAGLLNQDYAFDVRKRDYRKDESENLTGDLAGLVGCVRLARIVNDRDVERQATARVKQLLTLRVNLDRVNPRVYESTDSTTKHLHIGKLARYTTLIPEVGQVLAKHTDGCAADHLKNFREPRPGWHIAFGDRVVGGENYTNPLHFPRAVFAGMALVENRPAIELVSLIDVPWCRGDLYFIEKSVYALWVCAGRPMRKSF